MGILLWFDVCWCYGVVRLGWCGILMQAEALLQPALLFHYLMLNMFRMLVHPSSEARDLFVELFHVLYCPGSMCVGVTVWFGWGGVVSLCLTNFYVLLTVHLCIILVINQLNAQKLG